MSLVSRLGSIMLIIWGGWLIKRNCKRNCLGISTVFGTSGTIFVVSSHFQSMKVVNNNNARHTKKWSKLVKWILNVSYMYLFFIVIHHNFAIVCKSSFKQINFVGQFIIITIKHYVLNDTHAIIFQSYPVHQEYN